MLPLTWRRSFANHWFGILQTILDTSKPNEITETAEIELSRDEDNVTSLAVGPQKLLFAGINSSPKDVAAGRNQHFRIFSTETPAATPKGKKGKGKAKAAAVEEKTAEVTICEVSRASLFRGTDKDAYQRLLRLSKPHPNQPQLGAVATGLAKNSEIVLFDTSMSPPRARGGVQSNKEAVDVDFIQTGDDEYLFAYCDLHDIYVKKISSTMDDELPNIIYETPGSKLRERPTVPSFRAMRWLTKEFLLMCTNIYGNSGVVLQILRVPAGNKGQCRIAQSIRLSYRLTKATGMAVANLTPPVSPSAPQDYTQFVIAVAGQDYSISLFKVDLQVQSGVSLVTPIKPFRTFNAVHPFTITSLTFSNFTPPAHPITASTPPQYLKLASVSVNNTVVVHTLPLFPVPLSVKRGQSRTPRYVVALPSTKAAFGMGVIVSIVAILLGATFIQSLLEIRGGVPIKIRARDYVPLRIQELVGRPYEFPAGYLKSTPTITSTFTSTSTSDVHPTGYNHHLGVPADPEDGSALRLPTFFEQIKSNPDDVFVITHHEGEDEVKAIKHDEESHGPHGGKEWDELHHEQKEGWKKKLKDAGYWAEDMGETLLKGVVFGELAGVVGQAVGGG